MLKNYLMKSNMFINKSNYAKVIKKYMYHELHLLCEIEPMRALRSKHILKEKT